jgi:hypothetical protein
METEHLDRRKAQKREGLTVGNQALISAFKQKTEQRKDQDRMAKYRYLMRMVSGCPLIHGVVKGAD